MKNIAIYGSCATRDVFGILNPSDMTVVEYTARNSFASQFSKRGQLRILKSNLDNLSSGFQRRMVLRDFYKNFFETLKGIEFDCIVIDFIDERCRLLELESGILTYSNELALTKFLSTLADKGQFIHPNTDKHFERWRLGWDEFIRQANELGIKNKIVINRLFWASELENGEKFNDQTPGGYNQILIQQSNQYLKRLYDYCAKDIATNALITYQPEEFVANSKHKWGIAPFHYVDALYCSTHKQLLSILNSN